MVRREVTDLSSAMLNVGALVAVGGLAATLIPPLPLTMSLPNDIGLIFTACLTPQMYQASLAMFSQPT